MVQGAVTNLFYNRNRIASRLELAGVEWLRHQGQFLQQE